MRYGSTVCKRGRSLFPVYEVKRLRAHLFIGVMLLVGSLAFLFGSLKRLLVVDHPVPSDVIVIPSGAFAVRAERALDLAQRGFGNYVLIDEGAEVLTFGRTLAERRGEQTADWPVKVSICPIQGDSTYKESREAALCLKALDAQRVLIVTSDFHTRRALASYKKALPSVSFSVASVPTEFSTQHWWSPEAAATTVREWGALLWLRLVQK